MNLGVPFEEAKSGKVYSYRARSLIRCARHVSWQKDCLVAHTTRQSAPAL